MSLSRIMEATMEVLTRLNSFLSHLPTSTHTLLLYPLPLTLVYSTHFHSRSSTLPIFTHTLLPYPLPLTLFYSTHFHSHSSTSPSGVVKYGTRSEFQKLQKQISQLKGKLALMIPYTEYYMSEAVIHERI